MATSLGNPIADRIAFRLAVYLGDYASRVAVTTFSKKALQHGPETLTPAEVPRLCAALLPMLQTFIGRDWSELILASIEREYES